MKRSPATRVWWLFVLTLIPVLTAMGVLTGHVLSFEASTAKAQAHAALEENVRIALWRMDSLAAVLLKKDSSKQIASNFQQQVEPAQQPSQRYDSGYQSQLNRQEFQQRLAFNDAATQEWRPIEPLLLDRIRDLLPGATLEPAPPLDPDSPDIETADTRRLASIPARLVVPASALPNSDLPWNTPVRLSLIIAWLFALVAVSAVARLLGGTLALSQRRGDFASAVTHELRTPLTTLRMYAELLADGKVLDPAKKQHYLDTLLAESDRLGHLVENVLAYSRLENRLSRDKAEPISLQRLIDLALPQLQRRAQQAGLPLNVSMPDNADDTIIRSTDPIAVQQILINLVDNACKYGGTPIDLSIRMTDTEALEIRVADRGPGVNPATGKLFTAFGKSRTDTVPGIGLGLYLSRQLAQGIGGDLHHDPANPGATFVLTIRS